MSDNNLTRDDLILLMDSYRNHFAMNQTLLDQLGRIVDQQSSMMQKQDEMIQKQSRTCQSLHDAATALKSSNDKIDNIKTDIIEKVTDHNLSSTKEHGSLKNKIYVGWIGMLSIIAALIGLGIKGN